MKYRKLDADGDYQFGNGAEFLKDSPLTVAQAIYTRLLLHTNEWFLDSTEGTPYAEQIEGFGTQATRDPAIQSRIVGTPGVEDLLSYSSALSVDRHFTVNARISTLFGFVQAAFAMPTGGASPVPPPPPPPPCDCSPTAWQADFEQVSAGVPLLIGNSTIDYGATQFALSTVDPLYETQDLRLTFMEGSRVDFTVPAVSVSTSWTLSFSMKAPEAGSLEDGSYARFQLYSSTGETMRLTFERDGAGALQFTYFHPPTFNSGNSGSLPYDTLFNCELNSGEGRYRFYVNGVELFSGAYGGSNGLTHFTFAGDGPTGNPTTIQLDELRVTNIVEHTEDYAVALPFCTCPPVAPLWLDLFEGALGVPLDAHAQDIPLNSSVWTFGGETSMPILNGTGGATKDPGFGSQSGAKTIFTDTLPSGELVRLQPGWRYEFSVIPLLTVVDPSGNNQSITSLYDVDVAAGLLMQFYPAGVDGVDAHVDIQLGSAGGLDSYPLVAGENSVVILMEEDGFTATVNGLTNGKFFTPDVPMQIGRLNLFLGSDFTDEPVPSATINRGAIYGTLAPLGGAWLFFDGGESEAPLYGGASGYVSLAGTGPVAFLNGVSVVNSDGTGDNTTTMTGGTNFFIPMSSTNPIPEGQQISWSPVDFDTSLQPVVTRANPAPSEWALANKFITFPPGTATPDFTGWTGGILTLNTGNLPNGAGGGQTLITFLPCSSFYPPVSIEYADT